MLLRGFRSLKPKGEAIEVVQLNEFIEDLAELEGMTTRRVANAILDDIGAEIVSRASRNAPVDTGELRDSYKHERTRRGVRIFSTAEHAMFIEFGTWSHNVHRPQSGTYTIRPKRPGGVLRFKGSDGNTVFAKSVEHPGIKPQRPVGRAVDSVMDDLTNRMADATAKMVAGE